MRPPLHVGPLSAGQVAALEADYRRTPVPAERTRAHIILLSHQGLTPPAIAALVRVDPATVRRTIHRYDAESLLGLRNRPRPGRPRKVTPTWEHLLLRLVEQDPRRFGVPRTAWTSILGGIRSRSHMMKSRFLDCGTPNSAELRVCCLTW